MVPAICGRLLPEDDLHVLEPCTVSLEHELGARDAGAVLAVRARLAVGEINDVARGEVRRQQNVEQAALTDGGHFRQSFEDWR